MDERKRMITNKKRERIKKTMLCLIQGKQVTGKEKKCVQVTVNDALNGFNHPPHLYALITRGTTDTRRGENRCTQVTFFPVAADPI